VTQAKKSKVEIVSAVLRRECADWWRAQARANDRTLSGELRRVLTNVWSAQARPIDDDQPRSIGGR